MAVGAVDLYGHARRRGDELERRQLLLGLQVDQQPLRHLRGGRRVDLRRSRRSRCRRRSPGWGRRTRSPGSCRGCRSRPRSCPAGCAAGLRFFAASCSSRRSRSSAGVVLVEVLRSWFPTIRTCVVLFSEAFGVDRRERDLRRFDRAQRERRFGFARDAAERARRGGRRACRRSRERSSSARRPGRRSRSRRGPCWRLCSAPRTRRRRRPARGPRRRRGSSRSSASSRVPRLPGAPAPHCRHQSWPAAIGGAAAARSCARAAAAGGEPAAGSVGVPADPFGGACPLRRGGRRVGEQRGHCPQILALRRRVSGAAADRRRRCRARSARGARRARAASSSG